jgi:hypothetical protein
MDRRTFFKLSAALAATTAVAACAETPTVAVASFEGDAQLVLNGLELFASTTVLPLLSVANATIVQNAEADAQQALSAIGSLASTVAVNVAQPLVSQIQADANKAISVLENNVTLPASVTKAIAAVQAVVPVLLASVSILTAAASTSGMSVADARAYLASLPSAN